MSDIPTDAFQEILQRVHVDSLFTSRSVCKSWCDIIDRSHFTKMHSNRGIGDNWILHRNKTGKFFFAPLRHLIYHNNLMFDCGCDKTRMESCSKCCIKLVTATNVKAPAGRGIPRVSKLPLPCCNGLVLISSNIYGWVIWNPFIGESLQLPICDEFPNNVAPYPYCGLGYDEVNVDYKVVRIVGSHTFICSVNSRAWYRASDFPSDCIIGSLMFNGAFSNGSLHWIAYMTNLIGVLGCIVSLNLTTEVYRKIPVPSEIGIVLKQNALKLVELSGCLFLTSMNRVGWFVVWKINDYNAPHDKIWTRVMCLNMNEHVIEDLSLIAYQKDENQLLLCYKSEISFWYDMKKTQLRHVSMEVDLEATGNYRDYHSLRCIYTPTSQVIPASLVRLRGNDGANERVTPEQKLLTRKRKRDHHETLGLKICFESACSGLGEG